MFLLFSAAYLWDLYGNTIAFVIHSLDPLWGLYAPGFVVSINLPDLYRTRYSLV